jgi:NADH-quinone oxidoreductase subunit C
VKKQVEPIKIENINPYQVAFVLEKDDVHKTLSMLKSMGWIQLSYLSAVDWPKENAFELVYIVMNWEKPVYVQIRTKIDRDNPVMGTVMPIFEGAKYYEREAHEFFGIAFPGNPDHEKQLILENWDDIPPLRKDFDPREYSDNHFVKREYTKDFSELNGKKSKQKYRAERRLRAEKLEKGGKK